MGSHSSYQRNFVGTSLLHKCSVVQCDGDIYMLCLYMVVFCGYSCAIGTKLFMKFPSLLYYELSGVQTFLTRSRRVWDW